MRTRKPNQDSETLIMQYQPLVHSICRSLKYCITPVVSYDDLCSAGQIGLIRAAKEFRPHKGASFKTFAYIYIRREVIGEIRNTSPIPQDVVARLKKINRAIIAALGKTGSRPDDDRLAEMTGLPAKRIRESVTAAKFQRPRHPQSENEVTLSLGDHIGSQIPHDPAADCEQKELYERLNLAIARLGEKEHQAICLYYFAGMTQKAIGRKNGVSEATINLRLASAKEKLKTRLK